MGLCASALEVNVGDLQPYGFLSRMWRSYRYFTDILALNRHMRSALIVVRRLTHERTALENRLREIQLDINRCREIANEHAAVGDRALHRGAMQEMARCKRAALRVLTMKSIADYMLHQISVETVESDMMVTLEYYSEMPFIRYDGARWNQVMEKLNIREALGAKQADRWQDLLSDMTPVDCVEADLDMTCDDLEMPADIRDAPPVPTDELIALAEARPTEKL